MTLEKTITFKLNESVETFCDVENLMTGDELFLNKSGEDAFEIFSPEGYSLVTFKNEDELQEYIGYKFSEFEDFSFEVTNNSIVNHQDGKFTVSIRFQVEQLAC